MLNNSIKASIYIQIKNNKFSVCNYGEVTMGRIPSAEPDELNSVGEFIKRLWLLIISFSVFFKPFACILLLKNNHPVRFRK